jgi:hypothetical protein
MHDGSGYGPSESLRKKGTLLTFGKKHQSESPRASLDESFVHYAISVLKSTAGRVVKQEDKERFARHLLHVSKDANAKQAFVTDIREGRINAKTQQEIVQAFDTFVESERTPADRTYAETKQALAKAVSEVEATVKLKKKKLPPVSRPKDPFTSPTGVTAGYGRKERNKLARIGKAQIGTLKTISELVASEAYSAGDSRTRERVEELLGALLKKVPKKLRKEVGDTFLRNEFETFIRQYDASLEEIKKFGAEVPTTKEGQEALFLEYVQKAIAPAEKPIDAKDPLAAMLQAKFRTSPEVAKLARYPKHSGPAAQLERTGFPAGAENLAGWVETSAVSVGFMMALKQAIDAVLPTLQALHVQINPDSEATHITSLAAAAVVSYALNIPVKNAYLQAVMLTGKLSHAFVDTVKKHPIKSVVLAGTVLGVIGPAIDHAIEGGLTARDISERIERVLTPAEQALQEAGNEFPQFVQTLRGQLHALVTAEAYPERIPEFRERYPSMSFGESGDGGEGPIYWSKVFLFEGTQAPASADAPTPEMLRIVRNARAEAGLEEGQSLADALQEDYEAYLEETAARRARIAALVLQIHQLTVDIGKQNIASIGVQAGLMGQDPKSPSEIIRPREELEQLLREQGQAYEALRTEASRKISVLTRASEELLPGSSLSIELPTYSLTQQFNDFIELDLTMEHPLIRDMSEDLAVLFHKDELEPLTGRERQSAIEQFAVEYRAVSEAAVRSIGTSFAFGATFLILLFRAMGSLRRGRRLRELHKFHLAEARAAEEERIDDTYEFVNTTLRSFFPSYPEVSRLRVRSALREFMFRKVAALDGDPEMKERVRHWITSNFFERGQNSEDTEALAAVKEVLSRLQEKNEYVIEFLDTLFPGYSKLTTTLDHDLALLGHVGQGKDLPEEEVERLKKRFQSAEKFRNQVNSERLETTYNALVRERADIELENTILQRINEDVLEGSDTYKVFGSDQENAVQEGSSRLASIDAKNYVFSFNEGDKDIHWSDISKDDQMLMRRVAEQTEASRIMVGLMRENRARLKSVEDKISKLDQTIITRQIQYQTGANLTVPSSTLKGEAASVRDTVSVGNGMFEDVAAAVRERLGTIPRDTATKGESYLVSDQIDAMVNKVFRTKEYTRFLRMLNLGRAPAEQLSVDFKVVYDIKMDQTAESDVEIPGFSLRLQVRDKKGNVLGYEDFQMSHVLMKNRDPLSSAVTFDRWVGGSMFRQEASFRKEWLKKHYAQLDKTRDKDGVFKASGSYEQDKARIEKFYKEYPLRWKQAREARTLINSFGKISSQDLDIFINPPKNFVDDDLPKKEDVLRVVAAYYRETESKGFFDSFRARAVRAQGFEINIPGWSIVKSKQNSERKKKAIPLAEYLPYNRSQERLAA